MAAAGRPVFPMRTLSSLFVSAIAASCVFPQYKATKIVEFTMPAKDLARLECESHNGGITVNGDAAATEVGVRVEMSVRGHSQAEADANLHLLEIGREQNGGTLRLFGKYPPNGLSNRSPSFQFDLKVPAPLALQLQSHNGDIRVSGTRGDARIDTHNGDIGGSLQASRVDATTHNGDIDLSVAGAGAIDGTVTTHNGDIDLDLDHNLGARIEAQTHNGRVTKPSRMATTTISGKRRLEGQLGDGSGRLVLESHNGDVVIR